MDFEFEELLRRVDRTDKEQMQFFWEVHDAIARILANANHHKREGGKMS